MVLVEVEVIGLPEVVVEWNLEWERQVVVVEKVVVEWHCLDHLHRCMEVVVLSLEVLIWGSVLELAVFLVEILVVLRL